MMSFLNKRVTQKFARYVCFVGFRKNHISIHNFFVRKYTTKDGGSTALKTACTYTVFPVYTVRIVYIASKATIAMAGGDGLLGKKWDG